MPKETPSWTRLYEAHAVTGENPIWCADGTLVWIDIFGPTVNRLDLSTGVNRAWKMPELIGSLSLMQGAERAIVALASGLVELRFGDGQVTPLAPFPYDAKNYRCNDGRCDRAGRFWVGTIRLSESQPKGGGHFYRYDEQGLSAAVPGVTVANGVAWSPDSRTMYMADRPNWQILAMDYDLASGTASNVRQFATVPEGEIPDGATVDAGGGYWIAIYGAGRILRYLPDGTLDRELAAPTPYPTNIAFGGSDYRTMFVTTGSYHLDEEMRRRDRSAGALFSCRDVGVRGLPEMMFTRERRRAA